MKHQLNCAWEKAQCEYRATHNYCPHDEHACTCDGRGGDTYSVKGIQQEFKIELPMIICSCGEKVLDTPTNRMHALEDFIPLATVKKVLNDLTRPQDTERFLWTETEINSYNRALADIRKALGIE